MDRPKTAHELAVFIAKWVARNAEGESVWLSPEPSWTVNAHSLLDQIVNLGVMDRDELALIVEANHVEGSHG